MAGRTRARVFFYGLSSQADLWADQIDGLGLEGVRFVLHHGREHEHIRVPMLGQHSVHTALRAAAVGLVEGMSWEDILAGLQSSHSPAAPGGRPGARRIDPARRHLQRRARVRPLPPLNLLAELEGRRLAVLGDMLELGAYEEAGHRMVGARAAEVADELVDRRQPGALDRRGSDPGRSARRARNPPRDGRTRRSMHCAAASAPETSSWSRARAGCAWTRSSIRWPRERHDRQIGDGAFPGRHHLPAGRHLGRPADPGPAPARASARRSASKGPNGT